MNRIVVILVGVVVGFALFFIDELAPDKYVEFMFGLVAGSESIDSLLDLGPFQKNSEKILVWLMVVSANSIPVLAIAFCCVLLTQYLGGQRFLLYSIYLCVIGLVVGVRLIFSFYENIDQRLLVSLSENILGNSRVYIVNVIIFTLMFGLFNKLFSIMYLKST